MIGTALRLAALLAVLLTLAPVQTVAAGEVTVPTGGRYGSGGLPFRLVCPVGTYLIGFSGRRGDWIDQLTPLCVGPGATSISANGRLGQSTGGVPVRVECPLNSTISSMSLGWQLQWEKNVGTTGQLLQDVWLACASLAPPNNILFNVGLQDAAGKTFGTGGGLLRACPPGLVATGVAGFSGRFIDDLTVVCNDMPKRPTQPIAQNPCMAYAITAVAQQADNLRRKCGFTGVAWTATLQDHMKWCSTAPAAARKSENDKRSGSLAGCGIR